VKASCAFALVVALCCAACHASHPQAALPQDALGWTRTGVGPPRAAAVGYVVNPQAPSAAIQVVWVATRSSEHVAPASLLEQPQPLVIPLLSPTAFPAVFERANEQVLVWGERGWAWAPLASNGLAFVALEPLLNGAIAQSERAAASPTGADGASLHKDRLVVLEPQPIRSEPADTAAAVGAIPQHWVAHEASAQGQDAGQELGRRRLEIDSVVRVVARQGDWARVVLPDASAAILWRSEGDGLLVKWQSAPTGWARVTKPGPLPGTKVALWSTRAFGIGGRDY
jgi:hypothetical protein